MSSTLNTKHGPYDNSTLIAIKKHQAILAGQLWKNPVGDQSQKPFLREVHNAENGSVDYYMKRGLKFLFIKF